MSGGAVNLRVVSVWRGQKPCLSISKTRSAIGLYIIKSIGPRTELCGTPQISWTDDDRRTPRRAYCEHQWRYDRNHTGAEPSSPMLSRNRQHKIAWSTVWNRSNNTNAATSSESTACRISDRTRRTAVEWPGRKPDWREGGIQHRSFVPPALCKSEHLAKERAIGPCCFLKGEGQNWKFKNWYWRHP